MVRWLNTSFQFSRDFKAKTRTLNGYPANDCKSQSPQDLDELWSLIALVLFSFNFLFYSSKEWQVTCLVARTLGCGGTEQSVHDDHIGLRQKLAMNHVTLEE